MSAETFKRGTRVDVKFASGRIVAGTVLENIGPHDLDAEKRDQYRVRVNGLGEVVTFGSDLSLRRALSSVEGK